MNLKIIGIISCILLLINLSACIDNSDDMDIHVNEDGSADFVTIQAAIDAAQENATIFVSEGIYIENILINKSLILKGENPEHTIIDGNKSGDVIYIEKESKVILTGFTIRNSGTVYNYPNYDAGIDIHSSDNTIKNNIITNNSNGIFSTYSLNNNFTNNIFHANSEYGIYLYSVSNVNNVTSNIFIDNSYGLRIKGSQKNTVAKNSFEENQRGLYFCCGATNNMVYNNNFINNTIWHGNDYVGGNHWYNEYPIGGNYWDDYNGNDTYSGLNQNITGPDGIGDTIYEITDDKTKIDKYPLMKPITIN